MNEIWIMFGFVLGACSFINFFAKVNHSIAIREFLLMMYSINYLLSPAIIYCYPSELLTYGMKILPEDYFPMALLGMICLVLGMYTLKIPKPSIFKLDIGLLTSEAEILEPVLKKWAYVGTILSLVGGFFPTEIAFILYLVSLIRFVAAFGLFTLDRKKYWRLITVILVLEVLNTLRQAMFHELLMWVVFFAIFLMYIFKLKNSYKIAAFAIGLFVFFIIQNTKSVYRSSLSTEEAGIDTYIESADKANSDIEVSGTNFFLNPAFIGAVTRINQGWIFASTVDNLDRTKDFQEYNLISEYLKAALLPRALAPDKLKAGEKTLFNRFSGHFIQNNTSMGLGVFADGYISFGLLGVMVFCYFFGLMISFIIRMVYIWTKVSSFFFLFLFPIMNYIVRPDCELQTILGHFVKSIIIYAIVVNIYSVYFDRQKVALSGFPE